MRRRCRRRRDRVLVLPCPTRDDGVSLVLRTRVRRQQALLALRRGDHHRPGTGERPPLPARLRHAAGAHARRRRARRVCAVQRRLARAGGLPEALRRGGATRRLPRRGDTGAPDAVRRRADGALRPLSALREADEPDQLREALGGRRRQLREAWHLVRRRRAAPRGGVRARRRARSRAGDREGAARGRASAALPGARSRNGVCPRSAAPRYITTLFGTM